MLTAQNHATTIIINALFPFKGWGKMASVDIYIAKANQSPLPPTHQDSFSSKSGGGGGGVSLSNSSYCNLWGDAILDFCKHELLTLPSFRIWFLPLQCLDIKSLEIISRPTETKDICSGIKACSLLCQTAAAATCFVVNTVGQLCFSGFLFSTQRNKHSLGS